MMNEKADEIGLTNTNLQIHLVLMILIITQR